MGPTARGRGRRSRGVSDDDGDRLRGRDRRGDPPGRPDRPGRVHPRDDGSDATEGSTRAAAPSPGAHASGVPGSFRHVAPSADALIQQTKAIDLGGERSLVEVIPFMIVAEFGVLSSVTISAPSPEIGLGFFVLFLVGSAIFVRTPDRSYATALYHLAVGVSILLGHFWGQIPLEALLGQGYFATASMVAAVTGIAFSLLLGGR